MTRPPSLPPSLSPALPPSSTTPSSRPTPPSLTSSTMPAFTAPPSLPPSLQYDSLLSPDAPLSRFLNDARVQEAIHVRGENLPGVGMEAKDGGLPTGKEGEREGGRREGDMLRHDQMSCLLFLPPSFLPSLPRSLLLRRRQPALVHLQRRDHHDLHKTLTFLPSLPPSQATATGLGPSATTGSP